MIIRVMTLSSFAFAMFGFSAYGVEANVLRMTLDQPDFQSAHGVVFESNSATLALNDNKDEGFSWEIIVCDNNSTDKTGEIAGKMGARIAFEPINQISRARNTGA